MERGVNFAGTRHKPIGEQGFDRKLKGSNMNDLKEIVKTLVRIDDNRGNGLTQNERNAVVLTAQLLCCIDNLCYAVESYSKDHHYFTHSEEIK